MEDKLLREFRNKYGRVARIKLANTYIYLRGLRFGEWLAINKEVKVIIVGNNQQYDVTRKGIEKYIIPCILHPDVNDIRDTIINKPVHLNFIVSTVFELTEFNNDELLIKKYKRAMAFQTRLAEDIKRTLIGVYGIDVLKYIEKASADEITELLAMGEWLNGTFGQFFNTMNVENPIPINARTGKINIDKFNALLEEWLQESIQKNKNQQQNIAAQSVQQEDKKDQIFNTQYNAHINDNIENKNKTISTINVEADDKEKQSKKKVKQNRVRTISDVYKTEGYMEKDLIEVKYIDDDKPPIVKVNMSDSERKGLLEKIKPPKIYDYDPNTMDKAVRKMMEKEFDGQLINMWNEASIALYEKLQSDYERGKRITFQDANDLFMSELKSLEIDDLLKEDKKNKPENIDK